MTIDAPDGTELTAWWCTHLPDFTDAADQHGWRHTLDAANADIRAGTPTSEALTRHHIPIDAEDVTREQVAVGRGDSGTLADLGIDPVTVTGDYRCPAVRPCPRRAQPEPDTGHEPRCTLIDKTMILRHR
jgi:hypothetical protein